jgi:hypothetical protein
MALPSIDKTRALHLNKVFQSILNGQRPVTTSHDAKIFLEAAREQSSPSTCLETIVSSTPGLQGVRLSVRANHTAQFICGYVLHFFGLP